jgi:hypothetical protein
MYLCHRFMYVGHGGEPRPLFVVAPLEAVVVLLVLLPLRFPLLLPILLPLPLLQHLLFLFQLLLLPLSRTLPLLLTGGCSSAKGGGSGLGDVLLE